LRLSSRRRLRVLSIPLMRLLGETDVHVLTRVLWVLLVALAVHLVLDGIRESFLPG
jgi:small neutral amino acid transporter SnatA (MarC family)